MTIRLLCEDCQARIKVPDGAEGRKVKCPRCGAVQRVGQAADAPPPSQQTQAFEYQQHPPEPQGDSDLDGLASAMGHEETQTMSVGHGDDEEQGFDETLEVGLADHGDLVDPPDHHGFHGGEEGEDPLAALAAMSDEPDDEPDDDLDPGEQAEQEELESAPHYSIETLASAPLPDVQPRSTKAPIPLARPKPQPTGSPRPRPGGSSHPISSTSRPESVASPASQPRAIPMSNQPSGAGRPQAKPIPMGKPIADRPKAKLRSDGLLNFLGWFLRVMAGLCVVATLKLVLIASSALWPLGECLLVFLAGVVAAAMVWAMAEITFAVRTIGQNTSH